MADMVLRPVLPGHRLRAPGRDRGDRDVRGRAVGQGARRARASAVFGDHPLGRPVIGTRRGDRGAVPVPDIAAYHDAATSAGNLVLAAAGNIDHDRARRAASRTRGRGSGGRARRRRARPGRARAARRASTRRRPSSTTSASARPASPRGDERRFVAARARHDPRRLDLVAPVPGGAREARPRLRGLLVLEPVRRLRPDRRLRGHAARQRRARHRGDRRASCAGSATEPVARRGAQRAKENVKGRTVLSMESTLARMNRLGSVGADGRPAAVARRDAGEDRRRRRSTTWRTLARRAASRPSGCRAAGVGGDEDVFRGARRAGEPRAGRRVRDQRRGLGRGGPDGRRRSAPPSRAPTTWRSSGRADPQLGVALAGRARRRRRGRRLHHARHRARTTRALASRPACTA